MKRDRLRQSFAYLLIVLVVFAFVNISWADGVEVEVPYAVTSTQWWTGVAIKNLDESSATATLEMEFFSNIGNLLGVVEIDPLEPQEIFSEVTSTIYSDPLPVNYSIRVSQSGNEELAVTVFVGNTATGGFAFQTYNSRACCQMPSALPSWDKILPTAERFELVMNNEAVLDRETGLVWQRDTIDTIFDWYAAQSYCYDAIIGDRGGWRLPSVEELRTLVDPTENNPALSAGHPFTNVKSSFLYWSSTTCAGSTDVDYAWHVYCSNGNVYYNYKSNSYYVRAVRSGQ